MYFYIWKLPFIVIIKHTINNTGIFQFYLLRCFLLLFNPGPSYFYIPYYSPLAVNFMFNKYGFFCIFQYTVYQGLMKALIPGQ